MIGLKQLAPAVLALCSLAASAADQFTHRIVGGENASDGAWPSVAAIVHKSGGTLQLRQFCAGNVIDEKWVLTAAHCLFDVKIGNAVVIKRPNEFRVVVGVTDLDNPGSVTEIDVAAYEVHPFYDPLDDASYYDIAVLELATATDAPVMGLYVGDTQGQGGSAGYVVGWGATDYSNPDDPTYPSILQQVMIPLVTREVCNRPESYDGILRAGQFCAGFPAGGKDSCIGDSGGPIMLSQGGGYRQVGVVSFGDGCADPNKYGVYSDVPFFASWIEQYTQGRVEAMNGTGGMTPPWKNTTESRGGATGGIALLVILLLVGQRRYFSPRNSALT